MNFENFSFLKKIKEKTSSFIDSIVLPKKKDKKIKPLIQIELRVFFSS